MKYDLEKLDVYIEAGLIVKQDHPTLPLSIYNYSRTCQYEGHWDEITLSCRGLILDNEGNVIARPFPKFFNLEELKPEQIPNEPFEVFEKMDGSLGILFYYNDEWHLASKGSFTSEQAVRGRQILEKYKYKYLPTDTTYLFEIIYPENRIVVDYGKDEKLVMIASIQTNATDYRKSGHEWNLYEEKTHYEELGFEIVPRYDGINDYTKLKEMIKSNSEGFVIRFKSGMRMKIKGEDYVYLHRIITNISSKEIWMILKNGEPLEPILQNVPDEFDEWVKKTVEDLNKEYKEIENHCKFIFKLIMNVNNIQSRKDFANQACQYEHSGILFSMYDNKPYDKIIWKLVQPTYSKPFWNKEE